MLVAALALLDRTDVPVLVDHPERIVDDADSPLSCVLPPRHDPTLPDAVDEAIGLQAAHHRFRDAHGGRTGVCRLGGPDRIPELVAVMVRIADGAPWDEQGLDAAGLNAAALDIRAFYEESALALVEHVPAARQAESWLYRTTSTGAVLRRAHAALRAAEAPRQAWFPLLPTGQPPDPT